MPSDGLGTSEYIVGGRYSILLADIYAGDDYDLGKYGGYSQMFVTFLGDPRDTWDVYAVCNGKFPSEEALEQCDGIVVSGSRHDAHACDEWVSKLCAMIKSLKEKKQKILGVCFGHQIISRALGGKTGRSTVGWELGLRKVTMTDALATKTYAVGLQLPPAINILEVHRDQVKVVPPGGELLGFSDRCGIEMYAVGDNVLGIQGHPEFSSEFLSHIIDLRLAGGLFSDELAKSARASLQNAHADGDALQRLCKRFLKTRRV